MKYHNIKTVYLFGNPDLPFDAVPVELFGPLARKFPDFNFHVVDPNELDLPKEDADLIIIDTVEGLTVPRFIAIEEIAELKARVTAHDFDLGTYLLLAKKMNTKIDIRIIGIPMSYTPEQALYEVKPLLSSLA